MTEVLITVPCSDEIKLRLEEFKNSCVFLFKDRKSDIGSAEVVIGEPRTERIREAKNLKFVQMTWAGADIYTRGGFPQGIKIANASGAFGSVIAEYVIGAILCVYSVSLSMSKIRRCASGAMPEPSGRLKAKRLLF